MDAKKKKKTYDCGFCLLRHSRTSPSESVPEETFGNGTSVGGVRASYTRVSG